MRDTPLAIVRDIVARALAEDIGPGDITTVATVDRGSQCRAAITAKAEGVIAGLQVAHLTFAEVDPEVDFRPLIAEGAHVHAGTAIVQLAGPTHAILAAERTALNFLQRMSGIATLTAEFVAAVKGTDARIVDTRKTAPGLRLLDKQAVRVGGGWNHRVGLFDGVLIKENHVRAAGGIGEALRRARAEVHHLVRIEVEVQTIEEVEEAIAARADVIMLDNMGIDEITQAVGIVAGRCRVEASGGVSLRTVRALAESGVDYISVGALTHSAPALDLSLEVADD